MKDWLNKINNKDLKKDPSLQKNQPKNGIIEVSDEIEVDGSINLDDKGFSFEIIKRF